MTDLNEGRLDLHRSRARLIAFSAAAAVVFAVLGARLFQLQILSGTAYADRALASRTVVEPIRAPRGLVFDREGRPLVVNVASWTVKARPADLPSARVDEVIGVVARITGVDARAMRARYRAFSGSPYDLVPLARGVSREAALLVGEQRAQLPGIVVEVDPVRRYLDDSAKQNGSLLSHLIGYTGAVSGDELQRLAAQGYLPDDVIGRDGVEASYESTLRGRYGSRLLERDASGRPVKVISTKTPAIPGKNLMLTVDARVQRLAEEALAWGMQAAKVKQGVTIVMNPQTGEILAMVSLPTYDNNKFATGIRATDYAAYLADPNRPLRNHAISDIYPPGSTFKLVTGLAALQEGVTTPERTWPTYGCYQIPGAAPGDCLFDWNHAGFGPLDMIQAFAVSSDTFFYQMAVHLGVDRLAKWANTLGFGAPTGIRLPGEAAGIVASTKWAQQQGRPSVYTGELAQAGIGQNVIAVTPLQLLNAYAAVANGGKLMRPMVVRGETDAAGTLIRPYAPEVLRTLAATSEHLQLMRVGARQVITTGHAYNIRDLALPGQLSGKTGTAEFGTPKPDGSLPFHSWFVAFLPSRAGAADAQLAVLTFTYSATVPGNVSTEVVKYFLQKYFALRQDLRLDPVTFARVGRSQN
ncbi:MAG: penicillin-binding protein 2 [Chloroflexi bacterium]|nr:MAG: penicillin-binding protein 2 [Chloroflexota bacterium]